MFWYVNLVVISLPFSPILYCYTVELQVFEPYGNIQFGSDKREVWIDEAFIEKNRQGAVYDRPEVVKLLLSDSNWGL